MKMLIYGIKKASVREKTISGTYQMTFFFF